MCFFFFRTQHNGVKNKTKTKQNPVSGSSVCGNALSMRQVRGWWPDQYVEGYSNSNNHSLQYICGEKKSIKTGLVLFSVLICPVFKYYVYVIVCLFDVNPPIHRCTYPHTLSKINVNEAWESGLMNAHHLPLFLPTDARSFFSDSWCLRLLRSGMWGRRSAAFQKLWHFQCILLWGPDRCISITASWLADEK